MLDQVEQQPLDERQRETFIATLISKRDQAIAGRLSSGIESDWREDEEHYIGIDDHNRTFTRSGSVPTTKGATIKADPAGNRSTVFLNITRPYVDAAAARLADMLLPVDEERAYAINPTPIAEIDEQMQAALERAGIEWSKLQEQVQTQATESAKLMEDAIDDHLVECSWHGEVRTVIEDAARLGSGVLKGPVPKKFTQKKWTSEGLMVKDKINPASMRIDPWNFYPDPACGENIHNGSYTWERAYITPRELRDMMGLPGYDSMTILEVLTEGPKNKIGREAGDGSYIPADSAFELWTYYGLINEIDATSAGLEVEAGTPFINALALMVNDKLIKVALNALETGEFPYDVMPWQRRPGLPWGMGVARHIRTPQKMLNAASRAMMDNAGQIAGPQEVIGNGIVPDDNVYEIRGRKLWRAEPEVLDITKSFYCYVPPSHIAEFQQIIAFAREIAEQTTGMPMLLQGQSQKQGDGADTLGGMQLLQNNATGVLRRLAKRFDDFLTAPHIRRYYNWMMQFSERDDIKGDFDVDVRASSALVERDSQKQFMFAAMSFAANPKFGIDPYKLFSELAKADRMNPDRIQIPEEEYKQLSNAPSELDQANAALARAKADQASAAAILSRVEALFSAINTANAVAANPLIAPAADATAESAGFKDANAPPIVSEVPVGAEPTPMPQNTHPDFPPKAPSAQVGALSGIEGGESEPPPKVPDVPTLP